MFHLALLLIHVQTLSVSILMAAKMACSLDTLENWSDMYLQETGCMVHCSSVTHLTNDSGTMGFLEELKVCLNVDVSE